MIDDLIRAAEHAEQAEFPTDILLHPQGFRVIAQRRLAGMRHACSRFVTYDEAIQMREGVLKNVLSGYVDEANASLKLLG